MRNNELFKLEFVDLLTGMLNRNAYEKRIQAFKDNPEGIENITLVMVRLNNLRLINDTYGHYAGDEAIKIIARCMFDTVGDRGVCYRIDGNKFMCIAVGDIRSYISSLRDLVSFENTELVYELSISVGYAGCNKSFDNIDMMIHHCNEMINDDKK